MSKLAEALRAISVHNNFEILMRFGDANDVAIEYRRPLEGRMGWGQYRHTEVWSPRPSSKLERKKIGKTFEKEFIGNRADSFYAARNWAMETFGHDYAASPFGGLIPAHVLHRARSAITQGQES